MRDLCGEWKLHFKHNGEEKEIACKVPGNIELALSDAGLVPEDLFFGNNIRTLAPFEAYDFTYEYSFLMTQEELQKEYSLRFDGVDCFAVYYLNGEKIGESADALVEHIFPVSNLKKENVLRVELTSPITAAIEKNYTPIYGIAQRPDSQFVRKAPHSYGWDIMPRAVLGGIWRGVSLVEKKKYDFRDLYLVTEEVESDIARLLLNFTFTATAEELPEMEVEICGKCGESEFYAKTKPYFVSERVHVFVKNPKLWMPAGYGSAHLYDVHVRLLKNGIPVAEKSFQSGIRLVEVIRTPYTDNEHNGEFKFRVNHEDIFCNGTNWTPLDAFHSRDASRYERALQLLKELGCNMVRLWGGNVYEDHAFYDFCDKEGIMVWQDFAMACTNYPQDDAAFEHELKNEVIKVIRKLRQHTSIVIWCGDNECDHLYLEPESNRMTREIIPRLLQIHDPFRAFVPSSPYRHKKTEENPEKYKLPDTHLWGDGSYYKAPYYSQNNAHFISEIGYAGCPCMESMKKFLSPEKLWPWQDNNEWLTHATMDRRGTHRERIKTMSKEIKLVLGYVPDTLEEYIVASQVIQAEAYKYFIECTRVKKWDKTGILWWQLIDGWPQINIGVVDYYFEKKLAFHYIKESQQPLCMIADEIKGWNADVYMCNDTLEVFQGDYKVSDCQTGEIYLSGSYTALRNGTVKLGSIPMYQSEQKLVRMEWTRNGKTYTNYKLYHTMPLALGAYVRLMQKEEKYGEIFDAFVRADAQQYT